MSADLVVTFESYLTFEVNKIEVVAGSIISGLTEATLYGVNLVTISDLVVSVSVEPDLGLIAILTMPYLGVSSSSPPQALTDWALG